MSTLIVEVYRFLFSFLTLLGGGFLIPDYVLFESFESKTVDLKPVYNQIKLISEANRDIWIMNQSHHGLKTKIWDKVKIIVDKSTKPYQASYHQIKNGKEIEYKINCINCHSGGPRLIRPNLNSENAKMSLREKLTINYWNLRIRSYGEVMIQKNDPFSRKKKLGLNNDYYKQVLKVPSCYSCHQEGGVRSPITKQQVSTMMVLMENNMMPPWPHTLTTEDRNKVYEFIYGI
ncbi:cytochrome c [Bacteriovoracaceae bacterium]|nr:cytochrome c [Bacteriovoracaceae bacterium]